MNYLHTGSSTISSFFHPLEVTDLFGVTRFAPCHIFSLSARFGAIPHHYWTVAPLRVQSTREPTTCPVSQLHRFLAQDQYLLEGLYHQSILLPLALSLAKMGTDKALAIATFGAFFCHMAPAFLPVVLVIGNLPAFLGKTPSSGGRWPPWCWQMHFTRPGGVGQGADLAPRRRTLGGEARRVLCTAWRISQLSVSCGQCGAPRYL